ncbi:MAG TPA: hypothetical protein VG188_07485 [Solirubrobacteraceae bacterium]|nr:hypothetical protein [Solirubrobacteraceae bacterium]
MRRGGVVLLAWGLWLGVLTAVQAAFRSVHGPFGVHWIEAAMLGATAVACVLAGLLLWMLDSRGGSRERPRLLAGDSVATATLIAGLALALLGAGFGLWLVLIGVGVGSFGLGGLVRETLARRRHEDGQGAA